MTTPLSSQDIQTFTPASLDNLEPKPAFRLRPAGSRDLREYSRALKVAGLVNHDQEAVRKEVEKALAALCSPDEASTFTDKLRSQWALADQTGKIPDADREWQLEFMDRLMRVWEPLRVMNADIEAFWADAPKVALSLYLIGLSNLDVPFRMDMGRVPMAVIDDIERKLKTVEVKAAADNVVGVTPGVAFQELLAEALRSMNLMADEAQSFTSPSSPTSDPSGSKASTEKSSSTGKPTRAATPRSRSSKKTTSKP